MELPHCRQHYSDHCLIHFQCVEFERLIYSCNFSLFLYHLFVSLHYFVNFFRIYGKASHNIIIGTQDILKCLGCLLRIGSYFSVYSPIGFLNWDYYSHTSMDVGRYCLLYNLKPISILDYSLAYVHFFLSPFIQNHSQFSIKM